MFPNSFLLCVSVSLCPLCYVLSAACAGEERWTFLFVSAPLNVVGGVGSPPNALAIR